jgi:hypothetical protein
LQELIEHAKGTYQAEVDRLKDRDDRKYARNYDDNFIGPDLPVDPANDYSEYMEEEPHKAWAEHFEQMYKLPRGNPNYRKNVSNTAGPRPTYFYPVYALIKWWWEKKVKIGEFKPDYNVMYGPLFYDDVRYDLRTANSAARLLYLIAKECDPGYTVENCANLPRVWRK